MRKDTRIDIPGENLGGDIPKALLSYKNRIITNAIQDLHEKINELYSQGDKNNEIRGLQIKYKKLKDINILISKELGERIMNY
jgi:choline kinase